MDFRSVLFCCSLCTRNVDCTAFKFGENDNICEIGTYVTTVSPGPETLTIALRKGKLFTISLERRTLNWVVDFEYLIFFKYSNKFLLWYKSNPTMNRVWSKSVFSPFGVTQANNTKVINSGDSHISEPTLELHSRAAPCVKGNITWAVGRSNHREKSRTKKKKLQRDKKYQQGFSLYVSALLHLFIRHLVDFCSSVVRDWTTL